MSHKNFFNFQILTLNLLSPLLRHAILIRIPLPELQVLEHFLNQKEVAFKADHLLFLIQLFRLTISLYQQLQKLFLIFPTKVVY